MIKLKQIISLFFIIIIISFIVVYANIQYTFNKSNGIETVTSIPINLINKVSEV